MASETFFEYECKISEDVQVTSAAWSTVESTLAVVVKDNNEVLMFGEEGEKLRDHTISRSATATVMRWQPGEQILAIGWEDGAVILWHMHDRIQREDSAHLHNRQITLLQWKKTRRADENRLVTGDAAGVLGVWNADARGRLRLICSFRPQILGSLTHVLFPSEGEVEVDDDDDDVRALTLSRSISQDTSFYFGGEDGVVYYGDEMGHFMKTKSVGSAIRSMLYYKEAGRLVVVDASMTLTQIDVTGSGRSDQVKLSMNSGNSGFFRTMWVGEGLLLTACDEQMLRFWDLGKSMNYVLNIVEASEGISLASLVNSSKRRRDGNDAEDTKKWDKIKTNLKGIAHSSISSVAFSRARGILAAGTESGHLMMWRFRGNLGKVDDSNITQDGVKSTGSKCWQLVYHRKLAGKVSDLEWGREGGSGLLAVKLDCGKMLVLNETVLHSRFVDETLAVQISPNSIVVEQHTNSTSADRSSRDAIGIASAASSPSAKSLALVVLDDTKMSDDSGTGPIRVQCGVRIRGLALSDAYVVVWSGSNVEVYSLKMTGFAKLVSSFESDAKDVAIARESLYVVVDGRIDVTNLQGVVKQTLSFSDIEGRPTKVCVSDGRHMAAVTDRGMLKLYSVHKIRTQQCGSAVKLLELCKRSARRGRKDRDRTRGKARVSSLRVNASGTKVSVLLEQEHSAFYRSPDSRVYVYDADNNRVDMYDFGPDRYPVMTFWDAIEPRLLTCQTLLRDSASDLEFQAPSAVTTKTIIESDSDTNPESKRDKRSVATKSSASFSASTKRDAEETDDTSGRPPHEILAEQIAATMRKSRDPDQAFVMTLFSTSKLGLLPQDAFSIDRHSHALIGIHVPRIFFLMRSDLSGRRKLKARLMRDFIGLDRVNEKTRDALLEFSYNITIGNLDSAFRAVRNIDSPIVWQNMALMCVKTKRMDVAEVCLGNMGHARGAKAVRQTSGASTSERVAMVAIQLGLLDDAERLYEEAGRYDLLNELYRASGQWEKALSLAEEKDRIHLKTTHYMYARHLEACGNIEEAKKHYERSGTHHREVPRMFFDCDRLSDLEKYVKGKGKENAKLSRWWAQFNESNGHLDRALKYYRHAKDYVSQTRVLCFRQEFDRAADLVANAGDQAEAAAFHLARTHEALGNIEGAMHFYSRAGTLDHAVRLAMDGKRDNDLIRLALIASDEIAERSGAYFEAKGDFAKAVQLYQKSGAIPRALELCFDKQLFELLQNVAGNLDDETDPVVLSRCANFFMEHGQFNKAVQMFIAGKKIGRALEVAMRHDVVITAEMADRMTLPKKDRSNKAYAERRKKQILELARCCKRQGSFHLACKKYTQGGDKLKALKCLLKSGDTKKIIFFAGKCRSKEIYILAANYLQTLDWRNDTKIMRSIMQFYTKAKAFAQLGGFYESCAQVEIDDYRDYQKAHQALKEAVSQLVKAGKREGGTGQYDERIENIQQQIFLMERFIQARSLAKSKPGEMVSICEQLLEHPEVGTALRIGDVFALLVEYHYASRETAKALRLIDRMQNRNIDIDAYLDEKMVRAIFKAEGETYDGEDEISDGDDIAEDLVVDDDEGNDSFLGMTRRAELEERANKKSALYTRTGDKGSSSLYNMERRSKSDGVFEALGDTDELNSVLGIVREYASNDSELSERLSVIQSRLLDIGSSIATPLNDTSSQKRLERASFDPSHVVTLERWIDDLDSKVPPLRNFILPSGGLCSAHLHLARSVCRRAERHCVALSQSGQTEASVG
eukprot:g1894.t1